jgi:hypothetical protein
VAVAIVLSACGTVPPTPVAQASPSTKATVAASPSPMPPAAETVASPGVANPPAQGRWVSLPPMSEPRLDFTVTVMLDGRVLIVGGRTKSWAESPDGASTSVVEVFDATTQHSTRVASLGIPRAGHTATLLPSGKVVVAGGDPTGTAEIYDPGANVWTLAAPMPQVRYDHAAALIAGGRVFVTGGATRPPMGISPHGAQPAQLPAAIYDPSSDRWTGAATPQFDRPVYPTATLLRNGRVLVVGGQYMYNSPDQRAETSELYDPTANTWSAVPPETRTLARQYHTATLLPDGRVLVAGGVLNDRSVGLAVVYDPKTNAFTLEPNMTDGRCGQGAALLTTGPVLVIGSGCWIDSSATAEEFDLASNRWYPVASLAAPRGDLQPAVLLSGEVLAVGGGMPTNSPTSAAELFIPD